MERIQIKHQKYGILVRLPFDLPFDDVCAMVQETFLKDRKFFEGAELSLTFRGRSLSPEEEDILTDLIEKSARIRVLCLFSESPETKELFLKVRRAYEKDLLPDEAKQAPGEMPKEEKKEEPPRANVAPYMTIPGNLKSGDVYQTRENILILGDVEDHAVIVSSRNIVVLGSLFGIARAGEGREDGSYFIAAADLSPRKLFVRGIPAPLPARKGLLSRGKKSPGYVLLREGEESAVTGKLQEEDLAALYAASDLNLRKKEQDAPSS